MGHYFSTKDQKYTMKKRKSLQQMALGKLDSYIFVNDETKPLYHSVDNGLNTNGLNIRM